MTTLLILLLVLSVNVFSLQQSVSVKAIEGVLHNDLIIRAAKGMPVERTPIWLFRQAGRHLPEYNNYKNSRKKNFLELLQDPVDVAECTLQPIRRYNLDAAILFSDILVLLQAIDIPVAMVEGKGIQVQAPLLDPKEVYNLPKKVDIRAKLGHVLAAVKLIKKDLQNKVPLIGFSAAPFTLMYYLLGGSSKNNQDVASNWLKMYPKESSIILDMFTDTIIEYLSAQVEEGADLLQVFEAMGEYINEADFDVWALPRLEKIVKELKRRHPDVPVMVFPRGACYAISKLQNSGYDVVTIDTKTDRKWARSSLQSAATQHGRVASIQGNFDVAFLRSEENDASAVKEAARAMLQELGPQHLIANLGEGLTGKEDPALVATLIDSIHEISEAMIKVK